MQPKTFIFLGRSGCGKGTQADLLKKYLAEKTPGISCFHLEVGARFREFIAKDSFTSMLSRKVNSAGGLQPEFLAVWAWASMMIEDMKEGEHLIIDGTPRKLDEAVILDKALQFYGRKDVTLVFLDVSRDWSRKRLLARHRSDDNTADIEARLDWYETDVVPAVEYFRKHKDFRFLRADGMQSVEKVHTEIVAGIELPAKKFSLANLFK